MSEDQQEVYFRYLDDLRESGVTNMFGSPAFLSETFGLRMSEARTVVGEWMRTFEERHPEIR
jgi:hypothetical protein